MRITKISLILFAAFFFHITSSRILGVTGGGLSGIIKDSHGMPMAGAVVVLLEGRFNPKVQTTVTTDADGKFEVKDLFPGWYSLKVTAGNYIPLIKSGIGVAAGKISKLNLILESLYQRSFTEGAGEDAKGAVSEDIESVLRTGSSTRPILRVLDSTTEGQPSVTAELEANQESLPRSSEYRGVINLSATAYSADSDLMSVGGTFTEFALVKDVNPRLSWVVAGVFSDSRFAEIDSMLRLRDINGHNPSLRLSLGQLPYLSALSTVIDNSLQRLNLYNIDVQDELKVSSVLSVIYGAEFQSTNPSLNERKFRPRWGIGVQPTKGSRFSYLRTTSLPRLNRTLDLPEGENIVFSSPFQHDPGSRLNFGTNRVTHSEVASEQKVSKNSVFILGAYSDEYSINKATLLGIPAYRGFPSAKGIRVAYRQSLGSRLESVWGYTYGGGIGANDGFTELTPQNFHVLVAKLIADFSHSRTQIATTYRWISGYSITMVDPYQEIFESTSPGISLMVTQAIPYVGKFIPGKLEAQLDVRNLFAKDNSEFYNSTTLRRLEFIQPPKSVRGGINLKF